MYVYLAPVQTYKRQISNLKMERRSIYAIIYPNRDSEEFHNGKSGVTLHQWSDDYEHHFKINFPKSWFLILQYHIRTLRGMILQKCRTKIKQVNKTINSIPNERKQLSVRVVVGWLISSPAHCMTQIMRVFV